MFPDLVTHLAGECRSRENLDGIIHAYRIGMVALDGRVVRGGKGTREVHFDTGIALQDSGQGAGVVPMVVGEHQDIHLGQVLAQGLRVMKQHQAIPPGVE